jgi:CRP/FNR family transcriptional regulator, cyclic AMP receptor protein
MFVPNTLAAHPCFKTLDPDACRVLDRQCAWLKAQTGSWLVDQSANEREVYFIMSGHLRAVHNQARQDLIFSDMLPGSIFGEMGAFDGAPRAASVFAVTDSVVAKMPGPVFIETLFSHRPLGEVVFSTLIQRLRATSRRVAELGALNVRARVHAELLRLARPDHDNPKRAIIVTPPNQSELAARINTRRETVSREINAMERRGLIERRRGAIVITDAIGLSAAIEAASSV